ncbi:7336_t:CDS:2 [Funneliformis geosporum]|uniref:11338_t:CDS:1 n=1 Tax=Funneliformis geosporum TaxID=1117311 RepID=A0A9W4SDJ0_9GLOM|nr:7336_t:CDS:2 [Funneliformis geosporum]CAI2164535.1 11338_t:CDS:2 [Funneliformis geosporum]
MNKEDRIDYYRALTKYSNHEEALQLLKKLATHVRPIMKKRNWRVGTLEEFWPAERGLLGVNKNSGETICIRLRTPYDERRFYDFDDLIGTILHELTHIECGPHDAAFYKLLDELNDEYDDLMVKGFGFLNDGYQLGQGISHNVSPALAQQRALEAAEKRRKIEGIMTKGGIRLGGGNRSGLSLRELAAMAAERRRRDNIWCGNDIKNGIKHNNNNLGAINGTSSVVRNPRSTSAVKIPPNKIPGLSWTCSLCTFVNRPMALQCDVCLAEKIHTNEPEPVIIIDNDDNFSNSLFWSCPGCSLVNAPDIVMCLGCDYLKD